MANIKNNESTANEIAAKISAAGAGMKLDAVVGNGGEGFEAEGDCNTSYSAGKTNVTNYKSNLTTLASQVKMISGTLVEADNAVKKGNKS